jgi:glycosyltransferase involved in cell wall biosynthesis
MTTPPLISVCMPVYNAERYVAEAVESILGQTLEDFELVIIDDGSTDGSLGILQGYAERDPRIRLTSRPNKGLSATLRELVEQARGEWIARMDADDIALPQRLERQAAYLREHPDCVIVGTAAQVIDPDGDPVCIWFQDTGHELLDAHNLLGNRGTSLCHPSVMMRRGDVLAVGNYSEQYRIGEDLDLLLKLGERGCLANLPEPLLKYRAHASSFTRTRSDEAYRDLARVVADARRRRGLPAEPEADPVPSPDASNTRPRDPHETWGWQALEAGNVATARKHARRLCARSPLSIGSWRLLYCALRGY